MRYCQWVQALYKVAAYGNLRWATNLSYYNLSCKYWINTNLERWNYFYFDCLLKNIVCKAFISNFPVAEFKLISEELDIGFVPVES